MKNKKLWITIAFVVVCAAVFAGILGINRKKKQAAEQPFQTLAEAVEHAGFPLMHSDRLGGEPVSGYAADLKTIKVLYASAGYVSKTLLDDAQEYVPEEGAPEDLSSEEFVVNGVPILFYGAENAYSSARWTDNGFAYVISLKAGGGSATADEMISYIQSTR